MATSACAPGVAVSWFSYRAGAAAETGLVTLTLLAAAQVLLWGLARCYEGAALAGFAGVSASPSLAQALVAAAGAADPLAGWGAYTIASAGLLLCTAAALTLSRSQPRCLAMTARGVPLRLWLVLGSLGASSFLWLCASGSAASAVRQLRGAAESAPLGRAGLSPAAACAAAASLPALTMLAPFGALSWSGDVFLVVAAATLEAPPALCLPIVAVHVLLQSALWAVYGQGAVAEGMAGPVVAGAVLRGAALGCLLWAIAGVLAASHEARDGRAQVAHLTHERLRAGQRLRTALLDAMLPPRLAALMRAALLAPPPQRWADLLLEGGGAVPATSGMEVRSRSLSQPHGSASISSRVMGPALLAVGAPGAEALRARPWRRRSRPSNGRTSACEHQRDCSIVAVASSPQRPPCKSGKLELAAADAAVAPITAATFECVWERVSRLGAVPSPPTLSPSDVAPWRGSSEAALAATMAVAVRVSRVDAAGPPMQRGGGSVVAYPLPPSLLCSPIIVADNTAASLSDKSAANSASDAGSAFRRNSSAFRGAAAETRGSAAPAQCDATLVTPLPHFLHPAYSYASASVLFVAFTNVDAIVRRSEEGGSSALTSLERGYALVSLLNRAFAAFDATVARRPGLFRTLAMASTFVVVGGVTEPMAHPQHTSDLADAALEMLQWVLSASLDSGGALRLFGERCRVSMGLHTGRCAAGVIGTRAYALHAFGDVVNVAARLTTSAAEPYAIAVTPDVARALLPRATAASYELAPRGQVHLKGRPPVRPFRLSTPAHSLLRRVLLAEIVREADEAAMAAAAFEASTAAPPHSLPLPAQPRRILRTAVFPSEQYASQPAFSHEGGGEGGLQQAWLVGVEASAAAAARATPPLEMRAASRGSASRVGLSQLQANGSRVGLSRLQISRHTAEERSGNSRAALSRDAKRAAAASACSAAVAEAGQLLALQQREAFSEACGSVPAACESSAAVDAEDEALPRFPPLSPEQHRSFLRTRVGPLRAASALALLFAPVWALLCAGIVLPPLDWALPGASGALVAVVLLCSAAGAAAVCVSGAAAAGMVLLVRFGSVAAALLHRGCVAAAARNACILCAVRASRRIRCPRGASVARVSPLDGTAGVVQLQRSWWGNGCCSPWRFNSLWAMTVALLVVCIAAAFFPLSQWPSSTAAYSAASAFTLSTPSQYEYADAALGARDGSLTAVLAATSLLLPNVGLGYAGTCGGMAFTLAAYTAALAYGGSGSGVTASLLLALSLAAAFAALGTWLVVGREASERRAFLLRLQALRARVACETLLAGMLPSPWHAAALLRAVGGAPLVEDLGGVSSATGGVPLALLFSDIVGFTALAHTTHPAMLLAVLDSLYSSFDALLSPLGHLYKVDTCGDAYIAVAGLRASRQPGGDALRGANAASDGLHPLPLRSLRSSVIGDAGALRQVPPQPLGGGTLWQRIIQRTFRLMSGGALSAEHARTVLPEHLGSDAPRPSRWGATWLWAALGRKAPPRSTAALASDADAEEAVLRSALPRNELLIMGGGRDEGDGDTDSAASSTQFAASSGASSPKADGSAAAEGCLRRSSPHNNAPTAALPAASSPPLTRLPWGGPWLGAESSLLLSPSIFATNPNPWDAVTTPPVVVGPPLWGAGAHTAAPHAFPPRPSSHLSAAVLLGLRMQLLVRDVGSWESLRALALATAAALPGESADSLLRGLYGLPAGAPLTEPPRGADGEPVVLLRMRIGVHVDSRVVRGGRVALSPTAAAGPRAPLLP